MPPNSIITRCLATFHTHTGALKFEKHLKQLDISCLMKPVPRKLSSSCGVCIEYDCCEIDAMLLHDVQQIYTINDNGYRLQYDSE